MNRHGGTIMKKENLYRKHFSSLIGMAIILCSAAVITTAQNGQNSKDYRKHIKEGRDEARAATKVFKEIMNAPDKGIPRELLERAEAIGVFPNVVKAGFIFGGRGGDGLVSRKVNGKWTMPAFYNIGGASFGAQIGVKNTDYVMLFMNEGALQDLMDDKLEFEGSLSFAAGPVGRELAAGTNLTLGAGILIYSRSEGLFAGATIGGAVLDADNNVNEALYNMKAFQVIDKPSAVRTKNLPKELTVFTNTVGRYSK